MDRPQGYYWLRNPGSEAWAIGYWLGDRWLLPGFSRGYRDDELGMIGDPIKTPAALATQEAAIREEELAKRDDREADCKRLEAEVKRLRAALVPFAAVAKGIPDNWPAECRLREDAEYLATETHRGSVMGWAQWLAYWGVDDGGTFPKIDEWREAADAAREKQVLESR